MNQSGLHQVPKFYTSHAGPIQYKETSHSTHHQPLTPDSSWQQRITHLMTQAAYGTRILESLENEIRPLFVTSPLWGLEVARDIRHYLQRLRKRIALFEQFSTKLVSQAVDQIPPSMHQARILAATHLETFEKDQPTTEAAASLVMHHIRVHVAPTFRFSKNKACPTTAGGGQGQLDQSTTNMPDCLEELYVQDAD